MTFLTTADELKGFYLGASEVRCHADDGGPCIDCGGEIKMMLETAAAFRKIRLAHGSPIAVSSGYRCRKHQVRLWLAAVARYGSEKKAALHVARPGGSAHEYGCALDLSTPRGLTSATLALLIIKAAGPDPRIGRYRWGCHMDTAYLLVPNPAPRSYRRSVRWSG